jgi:hypothetical protein
MDDALNNDAGDAVIVITQTFSGDFDSALHRSDELRKRLILIFPGRRLIARARSGHTAKTTRAEAGQLWEIEAGIRFEAELRVGNLSAMVGGLPAGGDW